MKFYSILTPRDRPFRRLLGERMYTANGAEYTRKDLLATYYIQMGTSLEDGKKSAIPIVPKLSLYYATRIVPQGEFKGDVGGCFAGGRVTELTLETTKTRLSLTEQLAPMAAIVIDTGKVRVMKKIGRFGEVQRGFILATSQATLDAISIREAGPQGDVEDIFYIVHNRGVIKTFFAPSWS